MKIIKTKSEIFIFCGYIILAISFLILVFYFQRQNSNLIERKNELNTKELELKLKEIELKNTNEAKVKIEKLVPITKVDSVVEIDKQLNKNIKNESLKISTENLTTLKFITFLQVSDEKTKKQMLNQQFIQTLNSFNFNVINAFDIVQSKYWLEGNKIKYFSEITKQYAEQLKEKINEKFPEYNVQLSKEKETKENKNQVEIWIK